MIGNDSWLTKDLLYKCECNNTSPLSWHAALIWIECETCCRQPWSQIIKTLLQQHVRLTSLNCRDSIDSVVPVFREVGAHKYAISDHGNIRRMQATRTTRWASDQQTPSMTQHTPKLQFSLKRNVGMHIVSFMHAMCGWYWWTTSSIRLRPSYEYM